MILLYIYVYFMYLLTPRCWLSRVNHALDHSVHTITPTNRSTYHLCSIITSSFNLSHLLQLVNSPCLSRCAELSIILLWRSLCCHSFDRTKGPHTSLTISKQSSRLLRIQWVFLAFSGLANVRIPCLVTCTIIFSLFSVSWNIFLVFSLM